MLKNFSFIALALFFSNVSHSADFMKAPKFAIKNGVIILTNAGDDFVDEVASKQVRGKLRKVAKKKAYEWVDKFAKLSNKTAQASPDFTPINNLFNHLNLCDEIIAELYLANGEAPGAPLSKSEQISDRGKRRLMEHLEGLRKKLNEDAQVLVSKNNSKNFQKMIEFYDAALKETLDISQANN